MTNPNRPGAPQPVHRLVMVVFMLLGLILGTLSCSDSTVVSPKLGAPHLRTLDPSVAAFGDTNVTVQISGKYLLPEMVAFWNGTPIATAPGASGGLIAYLRNEDLIKPDPPATGPVTAKITVRDTMGQGLTSNALNFQIVDAISPGVIAFLEPDSIMVGSPTQVVSLHGSGFREDSRVLWDEDPLPFTYVDSTLVTFSARDSLFIHGADIPIRLQGLGPGAPRSNPVTMAIVNPAPVLESFHPIHLTAGQGGQVLTFVGEGFVADTKVRWDGQELPTYFHHIGWLQVIIPGELIPQAGSASMELFNPGPGGGTTDAVEVLHIQHIDIGAKDVAYDPNLDRLYAVSGPHRFNGDGTLHALSPATGSIIYEHWTQYEPETITLTEDGQYGYVGRERPGTIIRHILATGENELGFGAVGSINAITPLVGQPGSIAVTRSESEYPHTKIWIRDDMDLRPAIGPTDGIGYYECGRHLVRTSDPLVLIASSRGELNGLKRIQIAPDGTRVADTAWEGPQGVNFRELHYHDGLIYTGSGLVIDEQTLEIVFDFQVEGPMAVDGEASQVYFLVGIPASGNRTEYHIRVFDLETGAPEGDITLDYYLVNTTPLVKVGPDALAFLHKGIRLVRSPLFTPNGTGQQ